MRVAVIGSKGFIGSCVVEHLRPHHDVVGVCRENYSELKGLSVDCLVNCGGNSRKYWANQNRVEDFKQSVLSVYESLLDFKYKRYVYISSLDAFGKNIYGYHKRLAETLIENECSSYAILRCSAVIGKGMKKGVVKDIQDNVPLFVSPTSQFKLITSSAVSEVVCKVLTPESVSGCINVGSVDTVTPESIAFLLGKKVKYHDAVETQVFDYRTDDRFGFKTAEEYIMEIVS